MKYTHSYILGFAILTFISCSQSKGKADGYGNFEATEIMVSAENNGKLVQFDVQEAKRLEENPSIGYIDTSPLALKREQLLVCKDVVSSKPDGVLSQIAVLKAKLKTANTNKERTENLIRDHAGTQQQIDDKLGE